MTDNQAYVLQLTQSFKDIVVILRKLGVSDTDLGVLFQNSIELNPLDLLEKGEYAIQKENKEVGGP